MPKFKNLNNNKFCVISLGPILLNTRKSPLEKTLNKGLVGKEHYYK